MGTFIGRYTPIAIGVNASYDTKDEQAATFLAAVNTVTNDAGALPRVSTGATAKWVGVPTVDSAGTGGATAAYKDDTKIHMGVQHLLVTAPDVDSTANVAATANAIDKGVFGTLLVAAGNWDDSSTELTFKTGEEVPAALVAKAVAVDGFCYMICGTEVLKITTIVGLSFTADRGALGTTAAAHTADDAVAYYCGPDNTVIALDDESVWGTIAAHTAAGGTLTLICGTEQMRVVSLVANTIPNTLIATRGFDGTTAADHADNAAVTQYIDEDTCLFDVNNGALLVDEAFYKVETGGLEVIQVKDIDTHRITVERGQNGSPESPIGATANLFRLWGPETLDAALTAVNATSGMPDFEEFGGPPLNTLGYNSQGALASTETQVEAT